MEEFKVQKLHGASNWSIWKFRICIVLTSMDVYNITDGSAKKPVTPAFHKELGDWQTADIRAQRFFFIIPCSERVY